MGGAVVVCHEIYTHTRVMNRMETRNERIEYKPTLYAALYYYDNIFYKVPYIIHTVLPPQCLIYRLDRDRLTPYR